MNAEQKACVQGRTSRCDFATELQGIGRATGVNVVQQNRGPGAVLRSIPTKIPTMEQLGLPPVFKEMCQKERGLVLVTGPTGSGKSTTLAAMVREINETWDAHILTVEDPIEFVHEPIRCVVNQREVGPHTKSFTNALRSALREDPDVILVGEMRDLETISLAITAAETGPPRVRHAAHLERAEDRRPHHRRVPRRSAGADPLDAVGVARGGRRADAR